LFNDFAAFTFLVSKFLQHLINEIVVSVSNSGMDFHLHAFLIFEPASASLLSRKNFASAYFIYCD